MRAPAMNGTVQPKASAAVLWCRPSRPFTAATTTTSNATVTMSAKALATIRTLRDFGTYRSRLLG